MNGNTWGAIGLVAGREISTRLRSKAYLISTAALILVLIAFTVIMRLIGGGSSDATVGFTAPNASLAAPLQVSAKTVGQNVETRQVPDEAQGRQAVSDGSLDALLVGDGTQVQVVVKKDLDSNLHNALNVLASRLALNQQITALGGDPARVDAAVATASVGVQPLEKPKEYNGQQLVLGIIAGVLIYLSLMINGQSVAQGVVEEKTSRVVELLLATLRPWQLMSGKVLGIGTVGLLQILAISVVGLISGLATGVLTISVSAAAGTVVWLIVWYLLGFLMYSIVFAGLGALVSRQEDVGGAVTPALMFVVAGYVVGISVLPSDPGSGLVEILSVIPVFAPTLMPMRLAMGGVPAWEAGVSVLLVVALIPALVWLAGRIYRNAVLRTGAKMKLREALTRA
ncbi:ABC transporter permease [Amycolatopsis acidiphila]|uniref:ABC transporter permease n=1 Tax=Amycolatopsis acidiphila TaxID=715473 RepID=A0A558A768_9PSEU|nr:ABC transporter permease [Amycolatopsis acidiphila]TVT20086.1 ABC transporter permease [Amycolatopsis acidiphila]UIJ62895.1 ABC transporter permease [Amycolatopsis acidiphila]GHG64894.1 ABC transporter permease [Amycolatopsis acidiphila]